MNILVFGDSITYGACDDKCGGWVNRLRLHLDKKYDYGTDVFNLGISGEVTAEVLARFDDDCRGRVQAHHRTVIIFAIGTNDAQDIDGADRVGGAEFERNIIGLVNKSRRYTRDIVFVGLTPVDEARTTGRISYLNEKVVQFDGIIEKVAKEQGAAYVKMFDCLCAGDLADGLHPNDVGHEKMFERMRDALRSLINVE
jgi:lysophospholipase L1-like esterase